MKINFSNLRRRTEVFSLLILALAHMTARRGNVVAGNGCFHWLFCIICYRKFLPTRFSLWEGPSGSPVRRSTHMRAKWRLLSSVRVPMGEWFVMVDETDSAEGEELKHVENWSYCYEGSGWPVTTATAIEAEYLPKGGLNGCSLALDGRQQSFVVFISVFGCHGSRCRLVRWDRFVLAVGRSRKSVSE